MHTIEKTIEHSKAKIGMGGGCHWCTEAVFDSLDGVFNVEQGYIASNGVNDQFSEAVIVHYYPSIISLNLLLRVHLHTHAATADHSFRPKYRSAVYYFDRKTCALAQELLVQEQRNFDKKLITQVFPFKDFKPSRKSLQQYYKKNKNAPFCKRYITPKLDKINADFKHSIM